MILELEIFLLKITILLLSLYYNKSSTPLEKIFKASIFFRKIILKSESYVPAFVKNVV